MTDEKKQPRLVLLCGLPASGKTTLAHDLAEAYGAVRFNPDEWELALGIDPFDGEFQTRLEGEFWRVAQRLIELGTSVILEWGFWARWEWDEKLEAGPATGGAGQVPIFRCSYAGAGRPGVRRRGNCRHRVTRTRPVGQRRELGPR